MDKDRKPINPPKPSKPMSGPGRKPMTTEKTYSYMIFLKEFTNLILKVGAVVFMLWCSYLLAQEEKIVWAVPVLAGLMVLVILTPNIDTTVKGQGTPHGE